MRRKILWAERRRRTVFVKVVAAWEWFMLRAVPGRPWGRRRQLCGGARRRPHGLCARPQAARD